VAKAIESSKHFISNDGQAGPGSRIGVRAHIRRVRCEEGCRAANDLCQSTLKEWVSDCINQSVGVWQRGDEVIEAQARLTQVSFLPLQARPVL